MVILRTFFMVLWTVVVTSAGTLEHCQTKSKSGTTVVMFDMNGQPLPTSTHGTDVSGTDGGECRINTTDLVANMSLNISVFNVVGIHCLKHQTIHFTDYNSTRYDEAILHMELLNCTFDINSLNTLMSIADTRVLIASSINVENVEHKQKDDAFQNLVTLSWVGIEGDERKLSDILNDSNIYPELAEIILKNITLDISLNDIKTMLPNLQSLEVTNSNLQMPPEHFPWTDSYVRLPSNLSRSEFMESHYSRSEYVVVPPYFFRRYFNLGGNNIQNLSNYSFHGILNKISLTNNGLETINKDIFAHVQELQNVDISNNKLISLPKGVFRI